MAVVILMLFLYIFTWSYAKIGSKINFRRIKTIKEESQMRAVITVIGKDMVGILAKVSTTCAEANANVIEVTQSVLQEFFAMVMLIDIENMNCDLGQLQENLKQNVQGMKIHVMHEDIFNSMHRI